MSREEIEKLAADVLASFGDEVSCAYLFGSVARGTDGAGSDIDVGVLFAAPPEGRLTDLRFGIEAKLEKATGRQVQVTVLNDAPPDLTHRVLRDGCLLVDNDPSHRIRFEVRARNEYFDIIPILRRYRRTGTDHR